jgi:tetratricopeptide (TPR) repeat protein
MASTHPLYVTAQYGIGGRTFEDQLKDYIPFLQSGADVLIFLNEDIPTIQYLKKSFPNLHTTTHPQTTLHAYKLTDVQLPSGRNVEKDTLEYIQFGNAKPELLHLAAEQIPGRVGYVWFDFDVLRLSKTPSIFLKRLGRAAEAFHTTPNKILIPGCVEKDKVNGEKVYQFPMWRFCGEILLVPQSLVSTFHVLTGIQLNVCADQKTLTWETNLWAALEQTHPEMFHWYSADHNDSLVEFPLPQKQKRVILLTMIKNEHKIIKRLIGSALSFVDAVCVVDTGSTDSTIEVLTEYFKEFSIPAKIYNGEEHLWQDFGHNRSQSFKACVKMCAELGWDAEHTYALAMDADMELRVQPLFKKELLRSIGYKIIQKSGTLEYYNTRFLKLSHPWVCTGVTHEYWDGGNTDQFGMDQVYISDIGDGGCKSDKFERDVRLLEKGLKDSPNNPRYLFYLAQSYKDNKQLDKAIEYYKKRIDAGGWYEEVWYSMYILMKLYAEKNMPADMEYWGQKAYEYRKERAENLLFLVRWFKDRRQYYKAWHYWQIGSVIQKPNDLLFIETDCYARGFDYERCIIHDYVFPNKKHDSIDYSIQFFNKAGEYCMYTNLQWFVEKLPSTVRALNFEDMGDYVATSTSLVPLEDGKFRLNVRYVNYRIQPNGSYLMMDDGKLSGDNPVRTENYTCLMNESFEAITPLRKMRVVSPSKHNTRIKGLEDLRLFYDTEGDLRCVGTSMEYSYNGKIRQVLGRYNVQAGTITQLSDLRPPTETDCEKNWIPYKGDRFIYTWHPFQIGRADKDGKLTIEKRQETPKFFSHLRGSSCVVEEGRFIYAITHIVMYFQPRKYYHVVVKIDSQTDTFVGYTDPFYFCNNAIEYCLGFHKQGMNYTAIVSQNDRNPVLVQFKEKDLRWRQVQV